jgi:hypothetical protein
VQPDEWGLGGDIANPQHHVVASKYGQLENAVAGGQGGLCEWSNCLHDETSFTGIFSFSSCSTD